MDAKKTRYAEDDLDALFAGASRILVGRGSKYATYEPGKPGFDRGALVKAALGPSGNLRAPAARVGKTWLIGFTDESWTKTLC